MMAVMGKGHLHRAEFQALTEPSIDVLSHQARDEELKGLAKLIAREAWSHKQLYR